MWKLFFILLLLACIPPLTAICLGLAFLLLMELLKDWLPLIIATGVILYVAYKLWEANDIRNG